MRTRSLTSVYRRWQIGLFGLVFCLLSLVSCSGPNQISSGRGEPPTKYAPARAGYRWEEKTFPAVVAAIPTVANAQMLNDDELCMQCHEAYVKDHKTNIHYNQSCETCHGPGSEHVKTRGKEPGKILSFKQMNAAEKSEVCMKCHEQDACSPGMKWRTSAHANKGVACTDCHTSHYNTPPGTPATKVADAREAGANVLQVDFQEVKTADAKKSDVDLASIRAASMSLGAARPETCFKCHQNTTELMRVAHPHQIGGPNGLQCTSCHDPHGNIKQESRSELCLQCHKGTPTMAWHSSSHSLHGVACVDCHNPHPNSRVEPFVEIDSWHVERSARLPMSVNQPSVCYGCHPKAAAEFQLPSHHPVREGKMVCSDCHDSHGGALANLREPTINLVCYRCHADKEGPFAWEHPPVTENCDICHNPHGAVANNLLHQPTTFLCLRCHAGHRGMRRQIDTSPSIRPAFYTDCSQCHMQVHGSDLPAATRTGPRLTR